MYKARSCPARRVKLDALTSAELTYRFRTVELCTMCGAPAADAKVIGRRLNTHQGWRPTHTPGIATTVVRCSACGLIFSNPLPIPLDVDQHYGKPPEDYWRSEYFDTDDTYFGPKIDTFLRL